MTNTHTHTRRFARFAGLLIALAAPAAARAQGRPADPGPISLSEALRLAEQRSQVLKIAEAGLSRARGQRYQARAQLTPQIMGMAGYQRTLQSQYEAISKPGNSGGSPSDSTGGGGGGLGDLPIAKIFASPTTVTLGLNFSQNIYTAGKMTAATKGAEAAERVALAGVQSARAQLMFDVAQAYYNAVASDRMAAIADSTLAQSERSLNQTTLARQVGTSAEFDLLRARVTRDNARPATIQAHANRDIAYLRLRQLLGLSLNGPMTLTTSVRDNLTADEAMAQTASTVLMGPVALPRDNMSATPDTTVGNRVAVKQAAENVGALQYALKAANRERLPNLQLTGLYQRFGYPASGTFLPNSFGQYYPNWITTLAFNVPILAGGRIKGNQMVAQANYSDAQQRLQQAREAAELDARISINQYEQAQAAYAASAGTDEQAAKAYQIAEVRYREGISTQLELDQSRTQLQQARMNRVVAARDFELARLRLALLRDLPLASAGGTR